MNYVENNRNPRFVRESIDITYKVVGWEDLTALAGAFKALKIEGKGNWVTDSAARVQTNSVPAKQGAALAQSSQMSSKAHNARQAVFIASFGMFRTSSAG